MPTTEIPREGEPRYKRYEAMPAWAKFILRHPNLSRWGPAFFPVLLSVLLGIVTTMWLVPFGILATTAYIIVGIRTVPAEDEDGQPNVALLVVLDWRLPLLFNEGLVLIIPGFSKLIMFQKNQINRDLAFENVRCRLVSIADGEGFLERISSALRKNETEDPKSGGEVDVHIGLTIQPNIKGWSLLELDDAGGIEAAIEILTDMIGEDVRQVGRQLTWLEATFATDALSVKLIADVTNKYNYKSKGEDSAVPILDHLTEDKIREYLGDARLNGFADTKGLGFLIRRVNVKSVTPRGKLGEAAEQGVVEELRMQGLVRNADAVADAVAHLKKKNIDDDGSLSKKDLVDVVLINDKEARVSREIKELRVPEADTISKALGSLFNRR